MCIAMYHLLSTMCVSHHSLLKMVVVYTYSYSLSVLYRISLTTNRGVNRQN